MIAGSEAKTETGGYTRAVRKTLHADYVLYVRKSKIWVSASEYHDHLLGITEL